MTFSTFSIKSVLISYPMNTPGSFLTVFMTKILKTSRQNEKLFLELQDRELYSVTKSSIQLASLP